MTNSQGAEELGAELEGFVSDYSRALSKNLITALAGISRKYIPMNTSAMRRNTKPEEDDQGPYVITRADYAQTQYYETLNHLIQNGKYQSITKTRLAVIGKTERQRIQGTRGKVRMVESYWEKLKLLRKAGMLTPRAGRWFELGFEDMVAGRVPESASDQAVDKAKSKRKRINITVDL